MTPAFLLAAMLATVPQETVLRDRCDTIEINSFHDDEARLVFTQAIFSDWCQHKGCEQIADWRLVRNRDSEPRANIEIRRDYATGDYLALWDDNGRLREVRAKSYRETWTQVDRELQGRERYPQERRRKLTSGEAWKP